jgi:hypothetical protein
MRHTIAQLAPHQFYEQTDAGLVVREYGADELRAGKLTAVTAWREAMESAPVEYSGHLFDFDSESRSRISTLALAGMGSPTGTWTTAGNIDVPADAGFMHGLFVAMVQRTAETHNAQRRMKTELAALTDAAVIAAYEVPQC